MIIENKQERTGVVTFKGKPVTLAGRELTVGDAAPDVALVAANLSDVLPLASSEGTARLFVIVPSVDTSVCSMESKKFSEALKAFPADAPVTTFVVSVDLPFAQKRWCGAEGVDNLRLLSDYRGLPWGNAWGLTIKEMSLLARAVYVVDKSGRVTYREIVGEVAQEPDYAAAIAALKAASV
ncbi:MAG: thiol peroxidase [Armatimonadetes bacterium]|nr:thiol peroxidase [Armatimonadota bacterium]